MVLVDGLYSGSASASSISVESIVLDEWSDVDVQSSDSVVSLRSLGLRPVTSRHHPGSYLRTSGHPRRSIHRSHGHALCHYRLSKTSGQ